jgi:hypothetical protein
MALGSVVAFDLFETEDVVLRLALGNLLFACGGHVGEDGGYALVTTEIHSVMV